MGSKNRIAKYIVPILQDCIDSNEIDTYYEPFGGGCNVVDKIICQNRIVNDIHPQLIAMFQALQKGWIPPEHVSEEEYINVRDNKNKYPDYYVGFVGFNATFGAKYFGGYCRGFKNDGVTPRDISNEAYRNLMKQIPYLIDVDFRCGDYLNFSKFSNTVIYCDPPYNNTTKYETHKFDYEQFWDWCREMSKDNYVFISEYQAPNDFECVWQKEITTSVDCKRGYDKQRKLRVEKMFRYSGDLWDDKR